MNGPNEKYSIEAKIIGVKTIDPAEHVFLQDQHLTGESFSGMRVASFGSLRCTFERCDFSKLKSDQVSLASGKEPSNYIECIFDGTKFRKLLLGQARLERCRFLDVKMESVFSHSAEFVDCVFSGSMRKVVMYGRLGGMDAEFTSRRVNEIRGNDFSSVRMSDVSFRQGVDLRSQKLPIGEHYSILEAAERKLSAVRGKWVGMPASDVRTEVLAYLNILVEDVLEGQSDLFLCRDSAPYLSETTIRELWKNLAESSA